MPKLEGDCDPDRDRDAAGFERLFAESPELIDMSYAARRILAMSAALFHRQGAAATSIRDITTACGLSPGALYKHFASKDDLLDVLVQLGHDRIERRIGVTVGAAHQDPVSRTAAFVRAYVLSHLEQPKLAQLVRREYLHLTPQRQAAVVARRRRTRTQLVELLRTGERAGQFALVEDLDATGVALMILDMCSRTSEWYHQRDADPPAELAERYVAAALRLVGTRAHAGTARPAVST